MNGRRWRSVVYLLLLLPVAIAEFVVAVTAWSVALGSLSLPLWWWASSDGDFVQDTSLEKHALTFNKGGFLRRIRR